ncbi:MAG: pre-peptidase C-terminal domain-containing protein [Flavobacteriales bacterium]|nr:pre-peptidase C-terminal domain-containing protein [Flavobacteriales bacterium]
MPMSHRTPSLRAAVVLIAAILSVELSAQRNCGSMEYLQQQIGADPDRGEFLQLIDQHAHDWAVTHGDEERAVVTIPVVFHIVYNTTAQNISDAKVQAQIAQLNADFARLNSDASQTPSIFTGVAANTEVQFCLAQRDPSGNATTGIVRRQTTTTSFSSNDNVKYTANGGSNAWPRDSYLNIWSCNLGSSLLGYAQFPGGAAATDGVVVLFSSVGSLASPGTASPFHYGRTLTHEVGHWLNLRHIWGDATCGNDQVSDTPVHNTSNGGCPTYPHYSTCSGTPVEMTSNYMDYTNDGCMNLFTLGQKTRMQALFGTGGSRAALLNSMGCVPPSGGGTCAVPSGLAASSITTSSATVSWGAVSGAVSYDLQYKTAAAGTWTTVNTTATSRSLTGLASATTYNYQVRANCSGTSGAYCRRQQHHDAERERPPAARPAAPLKTSTTTPAIVSLPLSVNALIANSTDADYYRFSTTGTSNLSITLGNLAADFDLRLLNSAGTQLASSANGSTASESITYNNAAAGTYFIHRSFPTGLQTAFSAHAIYRPQR